MERQRLEGETVPKEGYESVSLTEDAVEILRTMKNLLGAKSLSDTVIRLSYMYLDFLSTIKRYDENLGKTVRKHLVKI